MDKVIINVKDISEKKGVDLYVAYLLCPLKSHTAESFKIGQNHPR